MLPLPALHLLNRKLAQLGSQLDAVADSTCLNYAEGIVSVVEVSRSQLGERGPIELQSFLELPDKLPGLLLGRKEPAHSPLLASLVRLCDGLGYVHSISFRSVL